MEFVVRWLKINQFCNVVFFFYFVTVVPCIKKTFVKPVPNKALVHNVISSLTVTSEEVCKIQCFTEVACESYNFGPKEDGGHVCELSNSDAIRDPQDWVTKQRHFYIGTLV